MPPLPKPHWEQAALARAGGDSLKNAYLAGKFTYSAAAATTFFKKPHIAARVEEIRAERREADARSRQIATEEAGVDLAWIERHFKYVAVGAMRGDPVRDATGKMKRDPETGAVIYRPDRKAAVDALNSLGRMKGAFIDRSEIGRPGDFSRLTDEEFDAKLIEAARDVGLPAPALKMLEDLTNRETVED